MLSDKKKKTQPFLPDLIAVSMKRKVTQAIKSQCEKKLLPSIQCKSVLSVINRMARGSTASLRSLLTLRRVKFH
jgi:hypothetical protein